MAKIKKKDGKNKGVRHALTLEQQRAFLNYVTESPVLIPHFSCHHIRHTFCTRFCENETNLKVIQSIMGHANIETTMDIYAEATDTLQKYLMQSAGSFDLQLEPKDKTKTGYIIEFKAGKNLSDNELASLAKNAIKQIYDKKYFTDMEYHGIKNIGLFGVAFSGKHVATEFEQFIKELLVPQTVSEKEYVDSHTVKTSCANDIE